MVKNPLYEFWLRSNGQGCFKARRHATHTYAWAIPSEDALRCIIQHCPDDRLVEMGAGTGYWAMLLSQLGLRVHAYDSKDPRFLSMYRSQFFDVAEGTPETLLRYNDWPLMLCWPPYADGMARWCLTCWGGRRLIYIGEWNGCTADVEFHDVLDERFEIVDSCPIPQWSGLHDKVYILDRKV